MSADWVIFGTQKFNKDSKTRFDVRSRGMKFEIFIRMLYQLCEVDSALSEDSYLKSKIGPSSYINSLGHLDLSRCSSDTLRKIARGLIQRTRLDHPFWKTWLNPFPDSWNSGSYVFQEDSNTVKAINDQHQYEVEDWRKARPNFSEQKIQEHSRCYIMTYFLELSGAALSALELRKMILESLPPKKRLLTIINDRNLATMREIYYRHHKNKPRRIPVQAWLKITYGYTGATEYFE